MILPHTEGSLIFLMIICMLCWGSWAFGYKLARNYRFELFYFDFALGLGLLAVICAFTVGSLGFDGFSFTDDLLNARRQSWLYAFLAAIIFNFGNMLMLAAVAVAGMAVAFPVAFGMAMVVGVWLEFLGRPGANATILLGGTLLILISVILNSSAYSHLMVLRHEALARAGKAKSTRRPNSTKGIILAVVGGLVVGTVGPLLLRAQDPDIGVGPYALLFLFAAGVFVSTFVFNLFFMNLPVEGEPLEIGDYLKTPLRNHLLGWGSGAIWGIGALASFLATTPKGDARLGAPLAPLLEQAAPIIAALCGLLVWKEFKGGDTRVKAFAAVVLVLFALGLAVFSWAPLWAAKT
jgi:glucose uptake protein